MTVTLIASSGNASYDSSLYTATVNGSSAAVYGYTKTTGLECDVWESGDSVELSWLKYAADEETTVAISLADSEPIGNVTVYPRGNGVTKAIADGVCTLTIPAQTNPLYLYCEINGDRANVLQIFVLPSWSSAPAAYETLSNLGVSISSVDLGDNKFVTATAHGYSNDDLVHVYSDADDLPAVSDTSQIQWYHQYKIIAVDSTSFQLKNPNTGAAFAMTDAGSGTMTLYPSSYSDATTPLYFGSGTHYLGKMFQLGDNVDVYLDKGAVVLGGFDMRNDGVMVRGPGVLSGGYTTRALIVADAENGSTFNWLTEHAFFNGQGTYHGTGSISKFAFDNDIKELTCVAGSHYSMRYAASRLDSMQIISPWEFSNDGLKTSPRAFDGNPSSSVTDCYSFAGDDNLFLTHSRQDLTASRIFLVNSAQAAVHGGYFTTEVEGTTSSATLDELDFLYLGLTDNGDETIPGIYPTKGAQAIFRTWTDNTTANEAKGWWGATVTNARVWGQCNAVLFSFGNREYPFLVGSPGDQKGVCEGFSIDGLWTEETPAKPSVFWATDNDNKPEDFTFADCEIGGTVLHVDNVSTFFEDWPLTTDGSYPSDFVFDAVPSTIVVETGTASATANSYASVANADTYHGNHGSPAAWTNATTAQKEEALRMATLALDLWYGTRWSGRRYTSAQALDWPRKNVADRAGESFLVTEIPQRLIDATAALALQYVNGENIMPATESGGSIRSESKSIGGISRSVTYSGAKSAQVRFPTVNRLLNTGGLLATSGVGWGVSAL